MKITCECLVTRNKESGLLEPLTLEFPDDRVEEMRLISRAGWESGRRFKLGLASMEKDMGISTKDPLASAGERTAAAIVRRDFKQEFMGKPTES
jgi:hypothetical protein